MAKIAARGPAGPRTSAMIATDAPGPPEPPLPPPPGPVVRMFAGATEVCTLLEGDVVEPVTMPGLADGPVDDAVVVGDELLADDDVPLELEEVAVGVEPDPPADESPPLLVEVEVEVEAAAVPP